MVDIVRTVKELGRSLRNLWVFLPVVWKYRWYDYGYDLDMIDKMLEEKERCWGTKTHYVGDDGDAARIRYLRETYRRYLDFDEIQDENELLEEFLGAYAATLPELWD